MARYAHSSDNKGRIFIPAKLRETLGRTLFVTKSLDFGYLAVYTEDGFERLSRRLEALSTTGQNVRRIWREVVGEAVRCTMDAQGRIGISDELWELIDVSGGDELYITDMGEVLLICKKEFFQKQREEEEPLSSLDLSAYDVQGVF